jgi:hypothetical protein
MQWHHGNARGLKKKITTATTTTTNAELTK